MPDFETHPCGTVAALKAQLANIEAASITQGAIQIVASKGQSGGDVGENNYRIVRSWFLSRPCATNREAAQAIGLNEMAIGRHVRRIRKEWQANG